MGWTPKQCKLIHIAANLAGWNPQQRYMVMAHHGCPLMHSTNVPSVTHKGNTQRSYELVMAAAEASAMTRGADMSRFPRPAKGTWRELSEQEFLRTRHLIQAIAHEAVVELPEKFIPNFLSGFIIHQTKGDKESAAAITHRPTCLEDCDEGQLYRIVEGLKAWVGRAFIAASIKPKSFKVYAATDWRKAG